MISLGWNATTLLHNTDNIVLCLKPSWRTFASFASAPNVKIWYSVSDFKQNTKIRDNSKNVQEVDHAFGVHSEYKTFGQQENAI